MGNSGKNHLTQSDTFNISSDAFWSPDSKYVYILRGLSTFSRVIVKKAF